LGGIAETVPHPTTPRNAAFHEMFRVRGRPARRDAPKIFWVPPNRAEVKGLFRMKSLMRGSNETQSRGRYSTRRDGCSQRSDPVGVRGDGVAPIGHFRLQSTVGLEGDRADEKKLRQTEPTTVFKCLRSGGREANSGSLSRSGTPSETSARRGKAPARRLRAGAVPVFPAM
jgi:hypothetical protein